MLYGREFFCEKWVRNKGVLRNKSAKHLEVGRRPPGRIGLQAKKAGLPLLQRFGSAALEQLEHWRATAP